MQVELKKQPKKYLSKTDKKNYDKIKAALKGLEDWQGDIKALEGHQNEYRLKIPPYRVLFTYIKGKDVITITKINTRGDVYKV
jgi:mRNA-degrading endonuclease RelE of RelBE toxin-antitoxin system